MALQQFGGRQRLLARPLQQALDSSCIELARRAAAGLVAQGFHAFPDPALPGHAHGLDVEVLQLRDFPAERLRVFLRISVFGMQLACLGT